MATLMAEWSWAFVYDEANLGNELIVASLDFELRVASVALQTYAGTSQVVGEGDKAFAIVAACWNIVARLAVLR